MLGNGRAFHVTFDDESVTKFTLKEREKQYAFHARASRTSSGGSAKRCFEALVAMVEGADEA
jgi:hypothetical protein